MERELVLSPLRAQTQGPYSNNVNKSHSQKSNDLPKASQPITVSTKNLVHDLAE